MSYGHNTHGDAGINTTNQSGGTNIINQHIESGVKAWLSFGGCLVALAFMFGLPGLIFLAMFTNLLDFLK